MAETKSNPAAKPAAAKTSVAKASPAKKPAAKKVAAPKKAAAPKKPAAKAKKISPEERYRMVEMAAYYIAEHNNFAGSPLVYWTAAEVQISKMLSK